MLALTDRIAADDSYLRSLGIELSSWGPDDTTGKVRVTLVSYTPQAEALLRARYGEMIDIPPSSGGPNYPAGRFADSAPWSGGDKIWAGTFAAPVRCTAWFNVRDNTRGYNTMLTAGHCGAAQWWAYQNAYDDTNTAYSRGIVTDAGSFVSSRGPWDAERTGATGSVTARVWSTPTSQYRVVHTVGWNETWGELMCVDGHVTGEVCSQINALDQDEAYYDSDTHQYLHTTTHQTEIWSDSTLCQEGDSGGPVYTRPTDLDAVGQNVAAHGMITGIRGGEGFSICNYSPVDYIVGGDGPFQDNLTIVTQ
jgi:hypothetical protein